MRRRMMNVDNAIVPALIASYGVKNALSMFLAKHSSGSSLTNLCDRFFTAAAKVDSGTYTSQFYKYDTNTSSIGWKLDANKNLICTPSTNAVVGKDDYAGRPLFACFDVNYTIDAATLEPVIHAIKDIYGPFDKAPTNSLVGVMQMTGWMRRTSTDTTKTVEYRSTKAAGFKPLPEAVRVDGTVRGFVIHAKYAAGYNRAGLLSSVSGVQPAAGRPSASSGSASISHDGQIAKWREWGQQYGGSGLCDIAFLQLMLEIKYAVLGNAQVMSGCRSYFAASYAAAVAETGVTRILLTAAQANYFVAGSCVSLGTKNDRTKEACYDVCDIAKIVSIEDIVVDGTTYKAINLDAENVFDTTAGATYIIPQPWRTGSTDDVLGNDGSPTSNTSGKEPFKIQGIEVMLGVYEVPGDTACYSDIAGFYTIYTNRKAADITSNNSGTNPVAVGTIPKENAAAWKYIAELNWDANNQESYMLGQVFGAANAGYRAAQYLVAETTVGWSEWRAFGSLNSGNYCGLACANPSYAIGQISWDAGARVCGTGGNRGEYIPK